MKYFLDTEFHEYKRTWVEKEVGHGYSIDHEHSCDTIELISIGIVDENGGEYYAVCKEFDVHAAWNNEWLRDNVLKGIFDYILKEQEISLPFTLISLEYLINGFGVTKAMIASSIECFVTEPTVCVCPLGDRVGNVLKYMKENDDVLEWKKEFPGYTETKPSKPEFYAYYADYDWVVFCWLFGRMIDLPKNFPMYCRDLKQLMDDKANDLVNRVCYNSGNHTIWDLEKGVSELKKDFNYPKQENEHNALADAKWNYELYKFLKTIE